MYVYILAAISNYLFFLCRLKLDHMMEFQKCAFLLGHGMVTNILHALLGLVYDTGLS
jgi:hypothetical protein